MDVAVAVEPIDIAQRVTLGKPGLVRIVIPSPIVSQPTGIRFSAGVAVLWHCAYAADFAAVGVKPLRGGDRFCCVGGRQHGAQAILVVVLGRCRWQVDVAGQPCQRVVCAGLHIDSIWRGPACLWIFGIDCAAIVMVVGGGSAFGFLGTSALVVAFEAGGGDRVDLDLIESIEAVVLGLVLRAPGARGVAGSGDRAAAAFFGLLAAVVVQVGFQQGAAQVGLADFGQLISRIVFVGGGAGGRIADLLLHPIAVDVVAEALGLGGGAVGDLGQPVEGVVLVAVVQRGLAG